MLHLCYRKKKKLSFYLKKRLNRENLSESIRNSRNSEIEKT